MARLGDDVYEWTVEQLNAWMYSEGLDDCIETFSAKRIDGRKLLTLTDIDIRNLHVSHESKRKLLKIVEKFKKRKKAKLDRLFGESSQVQSKKPPSFSHDGDSEDDGWGSDEFSASEEEDEDSEIDGEYLEPEDDFTKPTGSPYKKETPVVQTGIVAQLKIGIHASLKKHTPQPLYEDDDDIYDEPPQEDDLEPNGEFIDEDLYEEPSDSSGGAVVERPPAKPPRVDNNSGYIGTRVEEQDTYEIPLEGEDISHFPSSKQQFIPTRVQQQQMRFGQQNMNGRKMEDAFDDDNNYEIEVPPPRPPKNVGKPASTPSPSVVRPPKMQPSPNSFGNQQPQKTVYRKPAPGGTPKHDAPSSQGNNYPSQHTPPKDTINHENSFKPQRSPKPLPGNFPPRQFGTSPSQGSPGHFPSRSPMSSNQGSLTQSNSLPPSPTRQTKPVLSAQGQLFQGIPLQPTPTIKPKPAIPSQKPQPSPLPSRPVSTDVNRPPVVPKARPKAADPTTREPMPPPTAEPSRKISGTKLPDSPKRRDPPVPEPPRKTSGPFSGLPDSPRRREPLRKPSDPISPKLIEQKPDSQRPPMPLPTPDTERLSPRPSTRGTSPAHRDPQQPFPPEPPSKSASGTPTRRAGPLPATPGHDRPPEPLPGEPAAPPRPPKNNAAQPVLPPSRHGHGDKKGVPLPPPPSSSRDSREQSSGSSMESGSADEPTVSLPRRPSGGHNRLLPPPPTEKSPLDMMKEAPWFHGSVDRLRSEANLRAINLDGAFLVRNSTKNPNEYSLSLLHKGQIRHLKIPKKDGQYVLGASGVKKFSNIIDLVAFYRQNDVDLAKGGKTKLTAHAQNISR